jgi:hypothetical protein
LFISNTAEASPITSTIPASTLGGVLVAAILTATMPPIRAAMTSTMRIAAMNIVDGS